LPEQCFVLLCIGIAVAESALSTPARAQYPYPCAPGYYYAPYYGCVLPNYYHVPPYYAYPEFSFDFFHGGGWGGYYGHGGGWGGYYGHGGGPAARGGVPHGGAPHGGGGDGGGGHGGGGHGGGHGGH
jgi:hypothetical protein